MTLYICPFKCMLFKKKKRLFTLKTECKSKNGFLLMDKDIRFCLHVCTDMSIFKQKIIALNL